MARKTLKELDIKHIPFRMLIRLTLIFVTLLSTILVGWMLWQVYFSPATPDIVITNERVELLQASGVEEVETYQENGNPPPFPSSVFPTGDTNPLTGQ